jgi:hypothetical protein
MKSILIFICLFLNFVKAYCQLSDNDISVLNSLLNEITSKDQYVLISNPSEDIWKPINEKINSGKIAAWKPMENDCIINLTRKDKRHLRSQIISYRDYKWADSIFNNSLVINVDSMWSFLKSKNSEHSKLLYDAAIRKDSIFIKNNRYFYYWVISFTKPIYFEDNKACIASFYAFSDISAGWYQTAIYRKNEQGWYKCLTLEQGDY